MIQSFLDGSARIIREMLADARKVAGAIEFVRDIDWPPRRRHHARARPGRA
jgi:hypothetical protein